MACSESDTERFSFNERLKSAIAREFKRRVDPRLLNDALSLKVRLTERHEDEMRAKLGSEGRWVACDYLFHQLVKKTDWFKHLLKALADPSVGLADFADFCRQKEAYINSVSGDCTTDNDDDDVKRAVDEIDGPPRQSQGRFTNTRSTVRDSSDSDDYEPMCPPIYENEEPYDDARSLPYPTQNVMWGSSKDRHGGGQGRTRPSTIQDRKAADQISLSPSEHYYSSIACTSVTASGRHQESIGTTRGGVMSSRSTPTRPNPSAVTQRVSDGYTFISSRGSASMVRPATSSREGVPDRSPQQYRDITTNTKTPVARDTNTQNVGQPLRRAGPSLVSPSSGTSRGRSRDDENTQHSGVKSALPSLSSSLGGPQPSSGYYNEDPQTFVSTTANAGSMNRPSGNVDTSLRPRNTSKECEEDNTCSYNKIRQEDVSSRSRSAKGSRPQGYDLTSPHIGDGIQPMPQSSVPSRQASTYYNLNRGDLLRTASDSTRDATYTDCMSKGGDDFIRAEVEKESRIPTTNGAQTPDGGNFTREEVDTELARFPGYIPTITDVEVKNRIERCKDSTYVLWYCDLKQRPALGVVYNSSFRTFLIWKRSSYNGNKFYIYQDQKEALTLTELLDYHLKDGIILRCPYRLKIMLKYPFLE
ncbi:uncharacterized protein LOC124140126 [Haliotis rufescens]|uniref:uncharacterized protein LOC124140126 n=1 Tax=Haliotis rufescens TaxID=6454 RepID=UPI00201F4486|nr:uncharacterized protein LOC124140126 [Haliotis rufescens]XP_048257572.1 uncharacterized protein LOC124140126 [Haliotis rufescens]